MRYDSGIFYSLRCSVISGNKCQMRPGALSIARSVIPHSANYPPFRSLLPQISFRKLLSAFRILPTPNCWPLIDFDRWWTTEIILLGINKETHNSICRLRLGPSRATAGPGETFLRGPQTFSRGTAGKKFFEFFFSKWYILAYFIFLADCGAPQTSRGPR